MRSFDLCHEFDLKKGNSQGTPLLGCSSHWQRTEMWADQTGQGCGTHRHVCGLGLGQAKPDKAPVPTSACERMSVDQARLGCSTCQVT